MIVRTRRSFVAMIVIAAAAVACSSGGSATGSGPVPTTSVDLPPSYKFVPRDIVVSPGATVTWTNHDNFSHSVQFLDATLPHDALVMKPGVKTQFTFQNAGTFRYQCSLHPQAMSGTVTVQPAPSG
jgi:plastocyanin